MIEPDSIDWSNCPLVETKSGVHSGAPVLRCTRMPVSAIVDNADYGVSVPEIAEQFEIAPDCIEAVLAFARRSAGCLFLLLALSVPGLFAQAPIPIEVLAQSPADTTTELQVICLFQSIPSNTLHGSLVELNQKLGGVLDVLRTAPAGGAAAFAGDFGETLLIAPKAGTISARRLLIIGLGDARTFTPGRMKLVGEIVFSEANRLGVKNPFFAPTVLDGGVSGFHTGDVAGQFTLGWLRARDIQAKLRARGMSPGESVEKLTFLAGAAHVADTQAGIQKAMATHK